MDLMERFNQIIKRIQTYPPREVIVELAILWVVIFLVFRFLRGSGGARMIKSVALILIIATLAMKMLTNENAYERLNFLYNNFLGFASVALVIVFQPELRRAVGRLGEARFFRTAGLRKAQVIEELLGAVAYLSKNKIGALVVIERQARLDGLLESGTRLDAEVSKELLNTIFWPGSALHDMAVVIRDDRVVAAGVQLPLAEGEHFSTELGSRHRAAIGLSQEVDALVIIVSEETGILSLAERGRLVRHLSVDGLRTLLARGMGRVQLMTADDPSSADGSEAGKPA